MMLNDIIIYFFNRGATSLGVFLIEWTNFLTTRESYKLKAKEISLSNHTVWFNRKDNHYIAFFSNEETNDNLIIVSHEVKLWLLWLVVLNKLFSDNILLCFL